jgi:parallel beta-helix repeat protein
MGALIPSPSVQAPASWAKSRDGYRHKIHPLETAGGLTSADLTFGYQPGEIERYGTNTTPGTTNMTAALNNAIKSGFRVKLRAETYRVEKGAGAYVLTAAAQTRITGVRGQTVIKLASAAAACHIIGRATACDLFELEGVILDGTSGTLSAIDVNGVYLPEATVVDVRRCSFINLNNAASGGKGVYASNSTLVDAVRVSHCKFSGVEGNPVQTYYAAQVEVRSCQVDGLLLSFVDINGQVIASDNRARTNVSHNIIDCDASFSTAISVLSLMGDSVSARGNRIDGGGTQIVVHDGAATEHKLRGYTITGNFLWNAKGSAIVVNQSAATYGDNYNKQCTVTGNHIYQPAADGIAVVGAYPGSGALHGSVVIAHNTIEDGRTENPAPEAYAGIRLLGAVNAIVRSNIVIEPRWAGILAHYDGRNITISGNTIEGHQGRTNTGAGGATPQAGGAIFIGGGSATAYLGNIMIAGNIIRDYATQVSPQAAYVRTGAIVVNENKVSDVTIRGNRIMTGNTAGISIFNALAVVAQDNEVTGAYSVPLLTLTPGAGYQLTYAISYPRIGATGSRPTLTAEQGGFNYWDTTITKPIWWNGTNWKDQANATV